MPNKFAEKQPTRSHTGRRWISTCCIRNVFTLKYVHVWKCKAPSGWRKCRNRRHSNCWDLAPLGAHPLISLQILSGAAGPRTPYPCLRTMLRTEFPFYSVHYQNIPGKKALSAMTFWDWTPATNNIFLSIIAVKIIFKEMVQKEIWKSAVRNQWNQEMEMDGWTLWDCYRQLWFSEICWVAVLLAWEIH